MTSPEPPVLAAAPGTPLRGRVPYKWIVLSCTTMGVIMAVINGSSL